MPSSAPSREEELYWLALKLVPGLGTRTSVKLLDRFPTPQAVFRASRTELEAAGVSGGGAQSIASGGVELLQSRAVAVVGTRRPTPYGMAVAERLSGDLAHAGLTVVSGMARGVDTAAHRGSLAAGGDTIAVLGCGVDVVYPAENRKLAAELSVKGLIVSEFPM